MSQLADEEAPAMGSDAVAIIGMAGRFPGASDTAQFWRNLCDGVESVARFGRQELVARGVPAEVLDDELHVRAGAVLDGIEDFDADFFGVTPREAEITDPQHRVFLECAWEALEDGGYDPERFAGRIGVFAGAGPSTYLLENLLRRPEVARSAGALALQIGNNKDYVPLRVSYKLRLRGPSINVNTACSSSLVAVHLACQSLIDGQCDVALAGGVGIQVPQDRGYLYSPNGIVSPDGHCRAFDARAAGTVSGNGAGIVLLKRYDEALADGDSIRAVILGSAVNNDGGSKVGFTAPSVEGQARAVGEALAVAGVDPATLGYIEAHGTGTPLGDPIEVAALTQVFRAHTTRRTFCALGSVKTNIGHLDEAAGVAGLIKTALVLQHAQIPPSLHFERPNPELRLEHSPFYVPGRLTAWDADGPPRRASVSSFGIGGTNAHAVLQAAPFQGASSPSRGWQLLLLSGRTQTALHAHAARLAIALRERPELALADVAHTLLVGRKAFPQRRMLLCRTREEAVEALDPGTSRGRCTDGIAPEAEGSVAFLFPGQGNQHAGMGAGLYRSEPVFRDVVDRCAGLLAPHLGFDLRQVLYPEPGREAEATQRLEQTAVAQPALFTTEYALARLLMAWGITPLAMAGHSVGEYVAACLAGVFSWKGALRLVAERGRLMQAMPAGGMLAVELAEDGLLPLLGDSLTLALANAPTLSVAAGPLPALERLQAELEADDVVCRRLHTSHAFHSAAMDPVLQPFLDAVRQAEPKPPSIPFVSNVTGGWITAAEATSPEYWGQQLRRTVRFSDGVRTLLRQDGQALLEVGPGSSLATLVKLHPGHEGARAVLSAMRHPLDPRDDGACLLEAVGRLWLAGACAKPLGLHAHEARRRVPLPTYPFERRRFWIDPPGDAGPVLKTDGQDVGTWFYVPAWERLPAAPVPERGGAAALVFADPRGLGVRVAERLRAGGSRVVTVTAGAAFAQLDELSYIIDPRRQDDLALLLRHLAAAGGVPGRILHLWSITEAVPEPLQAWEEAQALGFRSLLSLVQALGRRGMAEDVCIDVVSSAMQPVAGSEVLCPEAATLLGLVRVVPQEFPGIRCCSIDLPRPGTDAWNDPRTVDLLLSEPVSEDSGPVLAIRDGALWRQAFALRPLAAPCGRPSRLRERGTYLVTGGLGSMGLAIGRYLACELRANLVLLGRSGLPPEAEWDPVAQAGIVQALLQAAQADTALFDADGAARLPGLLHAFCSGLICRYLAECGVALTRGQVYGHAELRDRVRLRPVFRGFLAFLLRSLAEDGIVALDDHSIEILRDPDPGAPAEARQAILAEFPAFHGTLKLVEHCAGQYRTALSGEIPSISVLYPDGTPALLDDCGRDTPAYTGDGICLKAAAGLVARVAAAAGDRTLRILEVGGGAGGLTRAVLAELGGCAVDYTFTDLAPSFVRAAESEAKAGGITGLRFGVLDIARDPAAQGYPPGTFDLVLGYNVVHATPRIAESLGHLRDLLAPGGLLLLAETTRLRRWDEMVWGLTEGWWQFSDTGLRTQSPLIPLAAWETTARGTGFDAVAAFPGGDASDTGLVLARRPSQAGEKTGAAVTAIRDMRGLGSEVLVLRADVADEERMRSCLAEVLDRFGTLDGVIHTAGVLGQELIHGMQEADAQAGLAPKALGILVLDKLLQERGIEPDFLLLCSSLASVAPVVGQAAYAGANAFLDAYAAHRAGRGPTTTISVGWGFWQELGMIEQSGLAEAAKRQIVEEISAKGRTGAGIEVLRRILDSGPPPLVLVAPDHAEALFRVAPAPGERSGRPAVLHPWLDSRAAAAVEAEIYVSHLDAGHWVLNEHRPLGQAVFPGTAYLELAHAAMATHGPGRPVQLRDVYFLQPLVVGDAETKEVCTILTRRGEGFDFLVVSRAAPDADSWHEHARGEIEFLTDAQPPRQDIGALESLCREMDFGLADEGPAGLPAFATRFRGFPPHWNTIERIRLGPEGGLATLRLAPEFAGETAVLPLHPALLDMATGFLSVVDGFEGGVPFCYRRVRLWRPLQARLHSYVRRAATLQPGERGYDAVLLDESGDVLLDVAGLVLRTFAGEQADPRAADLAGGEPNFCAGIEQRGSLSTLGLRPAARREPGPGEVELRVEVAGLNFIEVLYALGMLPEAPGGDVRFGLECAGSITAVGEGVDGLRPGDAVYGFAPAAFSRFATTAAPTLARVPEHLSAEQAATIPAAYLTAYYALVTRGRLRRGERVLIHAASGGVGLAAVNVARQRGADVFATAGSPEKREFLRGLGIGYVGDSRSTGFAAGVMEATGGRGVDVVLNSLGGEFIPAGLSVLARYGRFLELGKRDILRDAPLNLAPFGKHLSFMALDVGTDLPGFAQVWRQVVRGVQRGDFTPLPHRSFPAGELAGAFEHMAQGRHIGKVVLSMGGVDPASLRRVTARGRGRPLEDITGLRLPASPGPVAPVSLQPARSSMAHARPALSTAYRPATGDMEPVVLNLWEELLGVSGIGVDDNFFELRGDSLLAAQLTSRLYAASGFKLPLSSVFEHPTVAGLASRIEQLRLSVHELRTAPYAVLAEGEVEHEI